MDYTFSELKTEVERKSQWNGVEYAGPIESSINQAYFEVLAYTDWPEIMGVADVAVDAPDQEFTVPQYMNLILRIRDQSLGKTLHVMPIQELEERYARTQGAGLSIAAALLDTRGVSAQPVVSTVISAVSDDAGDLSQTLRVIGYLGGVPVEAEVTLNGLNSVSTAQSFDNVSNVSKSAETAGIVTVTAGAVTLSEISAKERVAFYRKIRLARPLDVGRTFTITYSRKPRKLSDSNDIPLLPEVGSILIDGAFYRVLEQQRDHSKATMIRARFLEQLEKYRLRRVRDDTSHVFAPSREWLSDRRGL